MSLVITGATIFAGTGEPVVGKSVLITDSRIAAVDAEVRHSPDTRVIDASGLFLMAGFIDAHSHLTLLDVPERPEPHADTPFLAVRAARDKLASGVTTVRDVGGNNYVDIALRRAIERGNVAGPQMLAAGKVIAATGGHIHYWAREADGPEEVRKAVREQIKAGADLVKLMVSGGSANIDEQPDRMQLQPDEIRTAILEAKAAGKRVAAHAHPSRAIRVAAEAGITSIEHGALLDDGAIAALVEHDVYLVPTQAVYKRLADNTDNWPPEQARNAQRIWEKKVPSLMRAIEAGVKIGVGTDSGRHFPSGGIVEEMLLLRDAGMTSEQVLLATTKGNADLLGLSSEIGTVEPGKRADLVLLGGDPLHQLEHAADVRFVITGDRVLTPEVLRDTHRRQLRTAPA